MDSRTISTLSACLNKWADPRQRGIPQGCSASDLLAETYLDPIDRTLKQNNVIFLRYSDDIRIFGKTKTSIRRDLLRLTRLLRERGLNIQSAKSSIESAAEFLNRLEGIQREVDKLHKFEIGELEVLDSLGYDVDHDIEKLRSASVSQPTDDALRGILTALEDGELKYNKSLVRYLFSRLAKATIPDGIDYAINTIIIEHPEETTAAIEYLDAMRTCMTAAHFDAIATHVASDGCVFDYQLFLLIRWFTKREQTHQAVLDFVTKRKNPRWLNHWVIVYRAICAARMNRPHDFDTIMEEHAHADSLSERITFLMAMWFAPAEKRKNWWGRHGDGADIRPAIEWVKQVKTTEQLIGI